MLFADLVTLFIAPLNAVGLRYAVTGGVATIAYEETLKVWVERRELGAQLEAARRLAPGG